MCFMMFTAESFVNNNLILLYVFIKLLYDYYGNNEVEMLMSS